LESFEAGVKFARSEGIIPAPESTHAIAQVIKEANRAREEGKTKTILFNLSGHGLVDMASYDQYFAGNLQDFSVTEKQIRDSVAELDIFPAE
jgi:tryptophan synthase beta chain